MFALDWVTLPVKLPRVVRFEMLVVTGTPVVAWPVVACSGSLGTTGFAVSSKVLALPLGAVTDWEKTADPGNDSRATATGTERVFFMAVSKKVGWMSLAHEQGPGKRLITR